jgi:hypothetical protein
VPSRRCIAHGSIRCDIRRLRHEDEIVRLAEGHDVDGAQTADPLHGQAIQPGAVLAIEILEDEGTHGPVEEDARVALRHHRRTQLQ